MFRREREQLQKLILVPYRPFRNLSLGLGGVLLIAAAGVGGFYMGDRYGSRAVGASAEEVAHLREAVHGYEEQLKQMREAAAVANHEREIVLGATEKLRQENKSFLENISSLQDQVAIYKKLLSPNGASVQGLVIDRLELRNTSKNHVAYRLLLIQNGNRNVADISGSVSVSLAGGGRSIELPVGDKKFAFQYFQSLSGEWQLPEGFRPERVDVVLKPNGKTTPVKRSFRWEIQS